MNKGVLLRGGAGLAAAVALATPLVMKWEGKRNDPYWDIARVRTVCYGETRNIQERRYSDAECKALLTRSLEKHARAIGPCLPTELPAPVHAAFVSLAYNIGSQAFCGSSVARRARAGDLRGACDAILAWNKARVNGQLRVIKGLVNRRNDERALCLRGLS